MIKANRQGGYITSWTVADQKTGRNIEVFYQGTSIKRTGIPPLFPCWNASGTNLRKHGFARDVEWKVLDLNDDEVVMTLDSNDVKEIIKNEYPKDFLATIKAKSQGNVFDYSMVVQNKGKEVMEIAPAIHPYFNIKHSDKLSIKTEGINGFDPKSFDWDNSPPDNHYPFSKKAKVYVPDWHLTIEDVSSVPVIKYLVVWSQPKDSPDFEFVCFEPVTALDGAIGRKEILLKPGEVWRMDLRFTLQSR